MKILENIIIPLFLSILLIYDFFPSLQNIFYIPRSLLIALMLIAIVLFAIINYTNKNKEKTSVKFKVFFTIYLLALTALLTVLGGHSLSGISIKNPLIWMIAIVTVLEGFKTKKQQNNILD